MHIPGFTADVSLFQGGAYGLAARWFAPDGSTIVPQLYCDTACQDACGDVSDCIDVPPSQRAACRAAITACRTRCCCPNPPVCGSCVCTKTCTDCRGRHTTQPC